MGELKASNIRMYQMISLASREPIIDKKKAKTDPKYSLAAFKVQVEKAIYSDSFAGWCDLTFKKQIDKDVERTTVTCDYNISRTPDGKLKYTICCPEISDKSEYRIKNITEDMINETAEYVRDVLNSYFWSKGFTITLSDKNDYKCDQYAGGTIELEF